MRIRQSILLALVFNFSVSAFAQVTPETTQKLPETTRERRELAKYYVLGSYSPFDLLIPSKYGFTLGMSTSADQSWEFEYLRGSVSVPFVVKDLGKMTDERYSLMGRSYFGGNSFNLSYGLTYFDFTLHLGDALLNRVSGGTYPSLDLVELQSVGFNVGVGNRWVVDRNFTFGVDWISWSQPVFITSKKSLFLDHATNAEDRDAVDKSLKMISYFPRFAFLKLQLGISF